MPQKGGAAKVTTDHEAIRRWVEERGGWPAQVKGTATGDEPGILRIDFPGYSGEETLERISWDEWFEKFDHQKLAFLFQDETARGQPSRFNKLVRRDSVSARAARAQKARGPATRATGATSSRGETARTGARAAGRRTARAASSTTARGARGASTRGAATARGAKGTRTRGGASNESAGGKSSSTVGRKRATTRKRTGRTASR